ncbi:MAG: hypothetical protein ACKN9F_07740, partial [Methylomonas sp.]
EKSVLGQNSTVLGTTVMNTSSIFGGCIQANMPFNKYAKWFLWGNWLNDDGDWQFDKERIKYELQKALYQYRFCPAIQRGLIQDVLNNLPDVVNPKKDKNWQFFEHWGDDYIDGPVISSTRFHGNVIAKGVVPNGSGALKEMVMRMKLRLPNSD